MYCSWGEENSAVLLFCFFGADYINESTWASDGADELNLVLFFLLLFFLDRASLAASSPRSANRLWGIDKEVAPAGAKVTIRLILVGPWILSCQTWPQWVNAECCFHQSCWSAHCFFVVGFFVLFFLFFATQHHLRWNVAAGRCI